MERRQMLEQFLQDNPNDPFARYGLAIEYVNNGDTDRALAEFARINEINPDYVASYQMAGQTLMKSGREAEARQMFEKGIAAAQRSGNQHAAREMEGYLDELRG